MVTQNAVPNALNDQLTTTLQWEGLVSSMGLRSGIFGVAGGPGLAPSFDPDVRAIDIAAGQAAIMGEFWSTDAVISTAIPVASGQNRIDRLVLRLDRNALSSAAVIQPVIISGTPGAVPVTPSIRRTPDGFYDLRIARWNSNSDGTLTKLRDERDMMWSGVTTFLSTARPTSEDLTPCLGIEVDTLAIAVWDGNSWNYLSFQGVSPDAAAKKIVAAAGWSFSASDPTSSGRPETWHNIPQSALQNGWGINGFWQYRLSDANELQMVAQDITVGTSPSDGSAVLSGSAFPASYIPSHNARFPVYTDLLRIDSSGRAEGAGFQIASSNGAISCYGIAGGAQRVDFQVSIPLDAGP